MISDELIYLFWEYKENELNKEFMNHEHPVDKYLKIRDNIREYAKNFKKPNKNTYLLTDFYSFISKSHENRLLLARYKYIIPSDSLLDLYYNAK